MNIDEYIKDKKVLYKSQKSVKIFIKDYVLFMFFTFINPITIPVIIVNSQFGVHYFCIVLFLLTCTIFLLIFLLIRLTTNYVIFTEDEIVFYNIFKKVRKIVKYTAILTFYVNITKDAFSINKNNIHYEGDIKKIENIIYDKCSFNTEQSLQIEEVKVFNKCIRKFFKIYLIFSFLIILGFAIWYQNRILSLFYAVKGDSYYNICYRHFSMFGEKIIDYDYEKSFGDNPDKKILAQKSYDYLLKSLSLYPLQDDVIWKEAINSAHYLGDYDKRDKLSQMALNIYPKDLFFQKVTKDEKYYYDLIIPLSVLWGKNEY